MELLYDGAVFLFHSDFTRVQNSSLDIEGCFCLTKTTSCASGSEKLLAMYQKSPPKVLY